MATMINKLRYKFTKQLLSRRLFFHDFIIQKGYIEKILLMSLIGENTIVFPITTQTRTKMQHIKDGKEKVINADVIQHAIPFCFSWFFSITNESAATVVTVLKHNRMNTTYSAFKIYPCLQQEFLHLLF